MAQLGKIKKGKEQRW